MIPPPFHIMTVFTLPWSEDQINGTNFYLIANLQWALQSRGLGRCPQDDSIERDLSSERRPNVVGPTPTMAGSSAALASQLQHQYELVLCQDRLAGVNGSKQSMFPDLLKYGTELWLFWHCHSEFSYQCSKRVANHLGNKQKHLRGGKNATMPSPFLLVCPTLVLPSIDL